MSYQQYNYYGSYDEDSRKFSYSIQDIHKSQREKDKQRLKIYESILSKCYKKIKELSLHEEFFCLFPLPEYMPGYPIYNMTECVVFLLNSLHDKGFHARYVDPFMIFISWTIPKADLRRKERQLLENKPSLQTPITPIENIQLKYKPIENSTPSSFFYKKNY